MLLRKPSPEIEQLPHISSFSSNQNKQTDFKVNLCRSLSDSEASSTSLDCDANQIGLLHNLTKKNPQPIEKTDLILGQSIELTNQSATDRKPATLRPASSNNLILLTKMKPALNQSGSQARLQLHSLRLISSMSTMELIKHQGQHLQQQFEENRQFSFHEKYVVGRVLGEGQHATVNICFERTFARSAQESTPLLVDKLQLNAYHPKPYAVKKVRDDDMEKLIAHEREFEILAKLSHKNIIKAIELFRDVQRNQVYQVIEFVDGSEILDEIAQSGAYDEQDAQKFFKQVLEGIAYLHENCVCHRDIKPSNILVTKDRSRAVLVDFNVAKKVEFDEKGMKMYTRSAGTLAFAAPERFSESGQGYSEKVDLWAAGVLLVMLLIGYHPFSDHNGSTIKLIEQILDGENLVKDLMLNQQQLSHEARDLCCRLVQINSVQRLSAQQALQHPWFEKKFEVTKSVQLETAQENLAQRRILKLNDPDEYKQQSAEGFLMSRLTKELLRFGLDKQADMNLFKARSASRDDECTKLSSVRQYLHTYSQFEQEIDKNDLAEPNISVVSNTSNEPKDDFYRTDQSLKLGLFLSLVSNQIGNYYQINDFDDKERTRAQSMNVESIRPSKISEYPAISSNSQSPTCQEQVQERNTDSEVSDKSELDQTENQNPTPLLIQINQN